MAPCEWTWWRSEIGTSQMVEELHSWLESRSEQEEDPTGYVEQLRLLMFVDTSGLLNLRVDGTSDLPHLVESNMPRDSDYSDSDKAETMGMVDAVLVAKQLDCSSMSTEQVVEIAKRVLGTKEQVSMLNRENVDALMEEIRRQADNFNLDSAVALAARAMATFHALRPFRDGNKRVAGVVVAIILRNVFRFPFRIYVTGRGLHSKSRYGYVCSKMLNQDKMNEEELAAYIVEYLWVGAGLDRGRLGRDKHLHDQLMREFHDEAGFDFPIQRSLSRAVAAMRQLISI